MSTPHSEDPQYRSLAEVHESVEMPMRGVWWRHWFAVTGPAIMAAVGYMDPGNWATDIAGGSRYNYTLIWVLLMSNLMAILLQSLSARLGVVALIIIVLNANLVREELKVAIANAGSQAWLIRVMMVPLLLTVVALLLYVTFKPWLAGRVPMLLGRAGRVDVHGLKAVSEVSIVSPSPYRRIVVAFDFGGGEERLLGEVLRMADRKQTRVYLLHVVESPVARALGRDAADREMRVDRQRLEELASLLHQAGIETECRLGAGNPVTELAHMINEIDAELVILGAHGHSGVSDLVHGTVVGGLRHRIQASVLVIPLSSA